MKRKKPVAVDAEEIILHLIDVWRRFHKLSGPPDKLQTREFRSVVAAVQKIQQGLAAGSDWMGTDYFADRELLGAYLLYQTFIHYQEGLSLIQEIPHSPKRVLDLGSGPGAFAFAALRHGATEVVAVDRNATALKLAGEVCGRYGYPLSIQCHDLFSGFPIVEGKFDLIILGHCQEELFYPRSPLLKINLEEGKKSWIDRLLHFLTPDGTLLLVESSQPHPNRNLLKLRDQLVRQGLAVQAPCVWRGECPALQTNTPCYAQREFEKPYLIREIQRAAQINLGSLKMSYLLVRAPGASWPSLPVEPLYRVISPPLEGHRGKHFYLCGTDGKKTLGSSLTEYPPESRAFSFLRRGDLIHLEGVAERGNHFELVEASRIKIEAAHGKAIKDEF